MRSQTDQLVSENLSLVNEKNCLLTVGTGIDSGVCWLLSFMHIIMYIIRTLRTESCSNEQGSILNFLDLQYIT